MFFSNDSIKIRNPDFGYLIRHYLLYTGCNNSHLNNLIGSSSSNVEGWTINVGFYQQNSHYQECYNNKSWHGYIGDDLIGSHIGMRTTCLARIATYNIVHIIRSRI